MKRKLSQTSAHDSNGARLMTFDNDGRYAYSTISQGNTYNIGGNLYTTASTKSETENNPRTPDTTQLKDRLLKSLYFEEINHRQEHVQSLVDDFGLTCQWILTPNKDHGFLSWCKNEGGLFWISGLAGTGKSTLMDFLHQELPSTDLLAGSNRFLRHFFSLANGSTSLQKSLEGLYRALCHQILSECDNLMDRLAEDASNLSFLNHLRSNMPDIQMPKWTTRALRALFQYLVQNTEERYVLLLDGLDECGDDHEDLLKIIHTFLTLGIRVICSSRPDEPFRSGLKEFHMIRLQDVNSNDIHKFCEATLQGSEAFELVDTVVQMSEGIFLWAALVAVDLRRESRILEHTELEKRLEQCPRGMFSLYQHMLERQRGNLRLGQHLAPYLLIFNSWTKCSDLAHYGTPLVVLFATALVLENNLADFSQVTQPQWLQRCREKAKLIEAQVLTGCAGIVRVVRFDGHDRSSISDNDSRLENFRDDEETLHEHSWERTIEQYRDDENSSCHASQIAEMLSDKYVVFVHKTASEFLNDKETQHQLLALNRISEVEVMLAITKVLISDPSKWQNHALLALDVSLQDRFDMLHHCAKTLEDHPPYHARFYNIIKRLLTTPFCDNIASPRDIRKFCFGRSKYTVLDCIYIHSLTTSENIVCKWIAEKLNSAAFLEHMKSLKVRRADLIASIAMYFWANPCISNVNQISILLSSQQLPRKTYLITRECSLLVEPPHFPPQEVTLWKSFMSSWLTQVMRRPLRILDTDSDSDSDYSTDPYHKSLEWFLESELYSADEMHMNLTATINNRYRTKPLQLEIIPEYSDEQRQVLRHEVHTAPREYLTFVFRMKIAPKGIMPVEFADRMKSCDNHTDDSPVQFLSLEVPGLTNEVQLSTEMSRQWCDITGLGRHCLSGTFLSSPTTLNWSEFARWQREKVVEMLHNFENIFDEADRTRLLQVPAVQAFYERTRR